MFWCSVPQHQHLIGYNDAQLHEALDASEAEVKKIHAQASEDSKRAVESTLAEAEREYESMLELEREKWQAHAERDRSEAILNTRKEIETRAKVELDKTLAFWRNTWSMEKDRAIEEALEGGREEARQEVAAERDEALRAARREWEQETSRAVATALREAERKAEVALDAEIAKHAAEMSALNSAYAVARELQLETKGLLEESEAKYRDSQAELVELQENFGLHGAKGEALVAGLKHAKAELIRMKSQLSAIRKECGAFSTRKAPQIAELARVMNLWNQDTKWNEYDSSRDPTPNCSLDDPVIKHLLMNWTQDKQKLQLLRKWLKHVSVCEFFLVHFFPAYICLLMVRNFDFSICMYTFTYRFIGLIWEKGRSNEIFSSWCGTDEATN